MPTGRQPLFVTTIITRAAPVSNFLILIVYRRVPDIKCFGTGLAVTMVRKRDESMKIEISFLAALASWDKPVGSHGSAGR
jgi:hypothetical protein